jgi:sulfhydrogenase subunit delta
MCLGPVTRAGCDAICPSYGSKCEACRGIVSDEALKAAGVNLREQYDVSIEDVLDDVRLYGAHQDALP